LLLVIVAALGVSVACNVAAAEPTLVGRAVAAWPPLALMLVVEVLSRAPLPAGRLRWVAAGGAGIVAVTAAVASFHHMHSVALAAGESELVAWLFPLTVDGLAVVASVALMGQHHDDPVPEPVLEPVFEPESVPVEPGVVPGVPVSLPHFAGPSSFGSMAGSSAYSNLGGWLL